MIHAGEIVTVTASDHSFELDVDGERIGIVPAPPQGRSTGYKAYATRTGKAR